MKGYSLEVIIRDENRRGIGSEMYHYKTKEEALKEMKGNFKNEFCILTEWEQFPSGLGNYEVEVARQNW